MSHLRLDRRGLARSGVAGVELAGGRHHAPRSPDGGGGAQDVITVPGLGFDEQPVDDARSCVQLARTPCRQCFAKCQRGPVAPERCSGSVHLPGASGVTVQERVRACREGGAERIAADRSESQPEFRVLYEVAGDTGRRAVSAGRAQLDQPRCGDRPACSGPDERRQDPVAQGQPFRECGGNVLTARAGIAPHGLPVPGTQAESLDHGAHGLVDQTQPMVDPNGDGVHQLVVVDVAPAAVVPVGDQ